MEPTGMTRGIKRGGVRDDRDAGGWSTGELEQAGEADWGEHKSKTQSVLILQRLWRQGAPSPWSYFSLFCAQRWSKFPTQSMAGLGSCVCCDFRSRSLPDYTAYLGSLAEVNAGSVIPIVITNINSHITYDTVPVKFLSVCLSLSYLLLFQDSCELQNKCKPKRP